MNAAGGNLALSATTDRKTTVKALPLEDIGGASLGIGASIAVNVVNDETTAGLEGTDGPTPGAALSNAGDLTLTATTHSIAASEASGRRPRRHGHHAGRGHDDLERHDERADRYRSPGVRVAARSSRPRPSSRPPRRRRSATRSGP